MFLGTFSHRKGNKKEKLNSNELSSQTCQNKFKPKEILTVLWFSWRVGRIT